ncbi:general transcription factor IIH subunit 4-like isoform X3 [Macrobrachium nipponense]|uniref:general transcription factor IIH subunit 4-like isoform X3 n=1 Tax=Macrobrachium nipponense TaxID=159736 RepID=UPI0030C88501
MSFYGEKTLTCKNLLDYLKSLPRETLDKLYNHPATCLAVFRELPELSRHFILRVFFVLKPIQHVTVASWIPPHEPGKDVGDIVLLHRQSVQVLMDMCIWQEVKDELGNAAIQLNKTFRENFKIASLGGDESESPNMQITSSGFQFLLLDTASQVWFFILKYLETVTERGLSLVECLTFLFKLSFSTLGKDYSMEGMDDRLLTFLQHLREFGLVYLRKRSSGRFYPTRLALNITAGQNKDHIDAPKQGNLIIETNYRIYAHTTSELQIALLNIFSEIEGRFPDMIVATITRGSVRSALQKGIAAEQIISFLRQHCHPQMYKQHSVVPRTVADQIKLWELERERLEITEGVLYKDFMSVHDFSLLSNFASSKGVLIYSDEKQRNMVVTKKGHPSIKQFWKEQSK